jgi:outer membrane protein TolC
LLLFISNISYGQTAFPSIIKNDTDSLSLKQTIEQVITGHPSIQLAQEAVNNANAKIGLAKTSYYPEADMTANFSNMGPVTKLSIPDMGTFQLFPENNYSASVNYRQVVYDFGRTRQNIEFENESREINVQTIEQVKQRLSLLTVNNFYTLVFLQAAIKIKDEQLEALNTHLEHVEKMMATGSATEYQVLATKVRISTVESQRIDLFAAMNAQKASLNSLLGNDQSKSPVVKTELTVDLTGIPTDSILSFAFHNRDEVLINQKKITMAQLRYGMVQLQNKPLLSLIASGGAKNGYVPELNKIRPNYIIGLGLKVPLFDGMKNKYNLSQAQSAVSSISFESELTKRVISNELYEAEAYMVAAGQKISRFDLQLTQALKAFSLAETSFNSGTITNLDLLDANTSVSESRLMLLKSRIDYAASIFKLKAALGERLYEESSLTKSGK